METALVILFGIFAAASPLADHEIVAAEHCGDYRARLLFQMGDWDEDPPKDIQLDYRALSGSVLMFSRRGQVAYVAGTFMAENSSGHISFMFTSGFRFFYGEGITDPVAPDCKIRAELVEQEPRSVRTSPPSDRQILECDVGSSAIVTCNKGRFVDTWISNSGDLFALLERTVARTAQKTSPGGSR